MSKEHIGIFDSATYLTMEQVYTYIYILHFFCRCFLTLVCIFAGYYSYLYAKCFASTIWQSICEEDPLSLSTGRLLRDKFFKHGGAKDPAELLKDLAGKEIISVHGEGIIPVTTCLLNELRL